MKRIFRIVFSDNREESFGFSSETFEGSHRLENCIVNVKKTKYDEFEIFLTFYRDVLVKEVSLDFEFDPEGTLLFNPGICTNAWANIALGSMNFCTRDICMVKGGDFLLNTAFSSFDTFYTCYLYNGGVLRMVFNFEDKPVKTDRQYRLETVLLNESSDALTFFDRYTDLLRVKYVTRPTKDVPVGWSSWSCYYNDINEERTLRQTREMTENYGERGADLVQLDDGWQKAGSFGNYWKEETDRFKSIGKMAEEMKKNGVRFGIWMAPGFVSESSPRFEELKGKINLKNGELVPSFDRVYPLKLDDSDVMKEIHDSFERGVKEFGAVYFKIDFPVNLIIGGGIPITYEGDYSVALYKKFVKMVRDTVGPDVFLLACGSPIGESVGYYDAIRATPDVSWGGAGESFHPGYWFIITKNVSNMMRRAPYNGKVFQNDPDGLIVRNYKTDYCNDDINLTYDEAELLTIAAAFCGGALLFNEEIDKLDEERKELFRDIIPPLGKAAYTYDFWEYPDVTHGVVKITGHSVKTEIHTFYNYDAEPKKYVLQAGRNSVIIDCRSKKIIASDVREYTFNLRPHSARALMVKEITDRPMFLYSDENIYLGAGTYADVFAGNILFVDSHSTLKGRTYIFNPSGCRCDIIFNGKNIADCSPEITETDGGTVYGFPAAD